MDHTTMEKIDSGKECLAQKKYGRGEYMVFFCILKMHFFSGPGCFWLGHDMLKDDWMSMTID